MRLLDKERVALGKALRGVEGQVYLYGSRTDPRRKGGDIDILVFSQSDSPYRLSQDITVRFQMECDEKIDVTVVDPDRILESQKAFVNKIRKEAVALS